VSGEQGPGVNGNPSLIAIALYGSMAGTCPDGLEADCCDHLGALRVNFRRWSDEIRPGGICVPQTSLYMNCAPSRIFFKLVAGFVFDWP